MTLNKYVCHIAQVCSTALVYRLHVKPTLQYIYVKQNSQLQLYSSCYNNLCANNKYAPQMHIYVTYANYFMCRHETTVSAYLPDVNSMQSKM